MVQRIDTDVILAGALNAIQRVGLTKLAMIDVAEAAGVSRHTLSRRFPTQQAMLDALGDYFVRQFEAALHQAIAARPDPAERVKIVVRSSFDPTRKDALGRLLELEPRFFRQFLKQHWAECVRTSAVMLAWPGPLDARPDAGKLTAAAELILRHSISMQLVAPDDWQGAVDFVTGLVERLLEPGSAPAPGDAPAEAVRPPAHRARAEDAARRPQTVG